jgi:hypothetical protein
MKKFAHWVKKARNSRLSKWLTQASPTIASRVASASWVTSAPAMCLAQSSLDAQEIRLPVLDHFLDDLLVGQVFFQDPAGQVGQLGVAGKP